MLSISGKFACKQERNHVMVKQKQFGAGGEPRQGGARAKPAGDPNGGKV